MYDFNHNFKLIAVKKLKRLIFSRNPVGQEEKTGLARFPLAVLSNTFPSAKSAKGTGRDRTYPTHVNTHENRTTEHVRNTTKNSSVGERRTARGCTNTPDECSRLLGSMI